MERQDREVRGRGDGYISLMGRYLLGATAMMLLVACSGEGPSTAFVTEEPTGQERAATSASADFAVAFIQRPYTYNEEGASLSRDSRELDVMEPGARLLVKPRATPDAPATVIAPPEGAEGSFDIRDLVVDTTGTRLAFAMRGPIDPDADEEDQPSWNIWTWQEGDEGPTRVISSDTLAETGQDRTPAFLADGRIAFTSTRQRQSRAILLDEGRPQFAAQDEDQRGPAWVLHVMSEDGSDIRQLSFNQSHDMAPLVMADGRLLFRRWDNTPGVDVISHYRINPDGTELTRWYGYDSNDGNTELTSGVLRSDGQLLAMARPEGGFSGEPVLVNIADFSDREQSVVVGSVVADTAETWLLPERIPFDAPSRRGRFASVFPLDDGTDRLLAAWSPCRLADAAGALLPCTEANLDDLTLVEAPPLYGLWVLDIAGDAQQPVVDPEENEAVTEAVILGRASTAGFLGPRVLTSEAQDLADAAAGAISIRSVYDVDGTDPFGIATLANPTLTPVDARPVMYLRLVKPVSLPDDEVVDIPGTAFGRSRANLMREILGYGTVHPDGSVYVQVPADVPFTLELVDGDGQRVSAPHRHWLQVRAGETMQCHGCHDPASDLPHGRTDLQLPGTNPGLPFPGLRNNYPGDSGASMAEGLAATQGPEVPMFDIVGTDHWNMAANTIALPAMRYQDLSTPAPASSRCIDTWNAACRATIHYPDHIHPLWAVDRRQFDADDNLLADNTCTSCHSPVDALDLARVPAGQLDLSDGPSAEEPDHLLSYRELLFGDNAQEVVDGVLVDIQEPVLDANGNTVVLLDANDEPVLDAAGAPIIITRPVPVSPVMRSTGAGASNLFFELFADGGSHAAYLTDAERRLIAEWLDVGAQYYNDPFVVPQ